MRRGQMGIAWSEMGTVGAWSGQSEVAGGREVKAFARSVCKETRLARQGQPNTA
jgi:hypothetical protein